MISERGPLPRRRRDLRARLDELRVGREEQSIEREDSASESVPLAPLLSARETALRSPEPPEVPRRDDAKSLPDAISATQDDFSSLDRRRFSRARAARRAATGPGGGGSKSEKRLESAGEGEDGPIALRPRGGAQTAPSRVSRSPDPTLLAVDEWIDPATADPDHFASDFPPRVPFGAEVLYLDLETTGLAAHEFVVIAGTLRPENGGVRLRQHVAFDPAEERRSLQKTLDDLTGVTLIVTYNGRTFDLPFLRKRLRWHRLPDLDPEIEHLDLLTAIRRRHRKEWKDCSLGNAERRLLGKTRTGPDVPGREVPLRVAHVRDGAPISLLVPVIHHNRIDLTSLVALHYQRLEEDREALRRGS